MGTANTLATYEPLLKENYTSKVRNAVFMRKYPLLSRLKYKVKRGSPMVIPLITGSGGGVASTYSAASASSIGLGSDQFNVTHGKIISVVTLSTFTEAVADGPEGGQIDYVKGEIDAKLSGMGSLIANQAYGNGGAPLGRRASLAGNVITLTNLNDALNFQMGMQLVASDNDGSLVGHVLRGGTPVLVTGVDRDLGTVTVDNAANIAVFTNNDWLFPRGMFAGNVSQTEIWKGLGAWFPLAAPTDTLFGLARTGRSELAGFRLGTGTVTGGVTERIIKLLEHGNTTFGSTPKHAFVHTKQWGAASREQSAQGYRLIEVGDTESQAGYAKLTMTSLAGSLEIVADPQCPSDRVYLLDLDTMFVAHAPGKGSSPEESAADAAKGLISFAQDDKGAIWTPLSGDLGHEIRMFGFANLVSEAPWASGVGLLPALVA